MQVVFNKIPDIVYDKNAYLSLIEEGYALPIETRNNATVLLFKDVDDHVDGNGMCVFWLLDGEGTFFYDSNSIPVKKGDVLVFNDNIQHGFEATEYCVAVNIGLVHDYSTQFIHDTLNAFTKQQYGNTEFSSIIPNF